MAVYVVFVPLSFKTLHHPTLSRKMGVMADCSILTVPNASDVWAIVRFQKTETSGECTTAAVAINTLDDVANVGCVSSDTRVRLKLTRSCFARQARLLTWRLEPVWTECTCDANWPGADSCDGLNFPC